VRCKLGAAFNAYLSWGFFTSVGRHAPRRGRRSSGERTTAAGQPYPSDGCARIADSQWILRAVASGDRRFTARVRRADAEHVRVALFDGVARVDDERRGVDHGAVIECA